MIKIFIKKILSKGRLLNKITDCLIAVFIIPSSIVLLIYRKIGSARMVMSTKVLKKIGVFPIRDHYYEPQFKYAKQSVDFSTDRCLPGIDLNINGQLELLSKLNFSQELVALDLNKNSKFNINNNFFSKGDAEIYYQIIRYTKPNKIVEIGSGQSTLIALEAIKKNEQENNSTTQLTCVEPYENLWLEDLSIPVIRKKIEDINFDVREINLDTGDILFIDSSHIIRPQGDVLKIYLEILPRLKSGVIVHIHDIFTPKNYLKYWMEEHVLFWNEQYLLEALLTNTSKYKIICALNYLKHNHYNKLKSCCPYLDPETEPGSFYIEKI